MLLYLGAEECAYAAIAQLDRVTDYESVGRGFESLSPYQKSRYPFGYLLFCIVGGMDSNNEMQLSGGQLQPPVQKLVATI